MTSVQLHGFSDASEATDTGIVYLCITDSCSAVHVSLVTFKTKVTPIKRMTVPRLELLGANLLVNLLHQVQELLDVPSSNVFALTESTIVLSWLVSSPHHFKMFVSNHISSIMELV